MAKRRVPSKTELIARLHRGLRPKLTHDQLVDLGLVQAVNLDAIVRGEATEQLLWDWTAATLTWSKVAELLQVGVEEMCEQLGLAERLVTRYGRTGEICFEANDYEVASVGLQVADELAKLVDRPTAIVAATWSEQRINEMARQCEALTSSNRPASPAANEESTERIAA